MKSAHDRRMMDELIVIFTWERNRPDMEKRGTTDLGKRDNGHG